MNQVEEIIHPKDNVGSKLGVWFLFFIELVLFGGLIFVYVVYRMQNTMQFKLAAMELNTTIGTLDTIILLTSGLAIALSVTALQKRNKFLSLMFILVTIVFAFSFIINKIIELSVYMSNGLFPKSEIMLKKTEGEIIYFNLFYLITGLHSLHVIIGIVLLSIIFVLVIRDKISSNQSTKLENYGLYFNLVVLIWIFIFPLFYLLR